MGGLIKVLLGMMTGDLGTIGEGLLDGVTEAIPEEVNASVKRKLDQFIAGLAIFAFILLAFAGQRTALVDVLGLPESIAALLVLAIFVAGVGWTLVRKRQHPEQALWTQFFGWYLAFGTAALITLVLNLALHWSAGRLYTLISFRRWCSGGVGPGAAGHSRK